jgi:hypothetical protein
MKNTERIAGGFFIIVLMILTLNPFNNDIQAAAIADGATEIVIAFAEVFPILWVGLIFTIAGFTGYDIFRQME